MLLSKLIRDVDNIRGGSRHVVLRLEYSSIPSDILIAGLKLKIVILYMRGVAAITLKNIAVC